MDYLQYCRVRDLAWQVLIEMKIRELPVRVGEICNQLGIAVRFYTPTDGKDGFCAVIEGRPHIFVSDRCSPERQRFTAAHELGHILMGHIDPRRSADRRAGDSSQQEQEANSFAGRLLAPGCVLLALNARTAEQIAALCWISRQAAEVRAAQMARHYEKNAFLTSALERKVHRRFKKYVRRARRKLS